MVERMFERKEEDYLMETAVMISAEDGPDFQDYIYSDGSPVKAGTAIGIEVQKKDGNWELLLFHNVFYANKGKVRIRKEVH